MWYSVTLFDHLGRTTCYGHFLSPVSALTCAMWMPKPEPLSFVKVWTHFADICYFCEERKENAKKS